MLDYTFCTINDVRNVLGSSGVSLASDDYPPTDYHDCIAVAGNQIVDYCYSRYSPENLAESGLVRHWAAVIAAYELRTTRGNPPPEGVAIKYKNAIARLEKIESGKEIPGIAARKSYAPVISIKRSTLRPFPRSVVERSRGSHATGEPENYRAEIDPYDRYGWNSREFLDWSF